MRRWLWLIGLTALTTGLLAAACGSGDSTEQTAAPQKNTAASAGGDVTVTQHDYNFQPAQISGAVGKSFQVTVTNQGSATHTFTIDELNIDQTISPGSQATITVTPSTPGQLTFYCRFHKSSGMKGTLTVAGAAGGASSSAKPTASPAGASSGGYSSY